ncbi:MAG: site-specific DNA-methyltransferase [Polyangiaceae bacterium]|nr:site-specific DNA-methyltransferase [Polyangiaceae bacterium]
MTPRSEASASAASRNRAQGVLLEGDCLSLVPLLAERSGPFDLAYLDPPFNAGGLRSARQGRGSRTRGAPAYRDVWGGIDAFLAMLGPRLAALRDSMRSTGSVWLHLDHRTVHEAKVMADRLFGPSHFRGEVIWVPGNGARKRKGPSVTHQTILIYACGREMLWNAGDLALREPYAETSLRMHFRNRDPSGRPYRERRIGDRVYRYYADVGRRVGSVWADCPAMRANTPLVPETTGYPTQKPESLLERIVRAASRPGDRVLDPMCGSGTTLVVAARLGRNYAGVDTSHVACSVASKRLMRAGHTPTRIL